MLKQKTERWTMKLQREVEKQKVKSMVERMMYRDNQVRMNLSRSPIFWAEAYVAQTQLDFDVFYQGGSDTRKAVPHGACRGSFPQGPVFRDLL